jgi:Brp/Blh family beta-carotene 15,15'-monooxygenase
MGLLGLAMVLLGLDSGPALYLPMLCSVFLFGLPHGAIDHLVLLGLAKRTLTFKSLLVVCAGYMGLVIAMLFLWWCSPLTAVLLFLAITIYHWGRADLAFETLLDASTGSLPNGLLRFNHALLRGFFPIGIPFLAFPESTEAILNACSSAFGHSYELGTALPLGILLSLLVLLISEVFYLRLQKSQRKLRVIESVGLIVFFSFVPPVLAVGLYFCLWHGFRHVLRLISYEGSGAIDDSITTRFRRFYHQALPFTGASVLIVGAVLMLLPKGAESSQWIGTYLVVISSLTVPHLLVVGWMDRREGV